MSLFCLLSILWSSLLCFFLLTTTIDAFSVDCPPGWVESNSSGTCVKPSTENTTWHSAQTMCKKESADLVKILDSNMNRFIQDLVKSDVDQMHWIGLFFNGEDKEFYWRDTQKPLYVNWGKNEPKRDGETCVKLNSQGQPPGKWTGGDCASNYTFICEIHPVGLCPDGWIPNSASGTCIKPYHTRRAWKVARSTCLEEGGDLVTILSDHENRFIWDQVYSDAGEGYWIYLNGQDQDICQWLDNNLSTHYTNWDDNEPSNSENCSCGGINFPRILAMKWGAEGCDLKNKFICEKNAPKKSASPASSPSGLNFITIFLCILFGLIFVIMLLAGGRKRTRPRMPNYPIRQIILRWSKDRMNNAASGTQSEMDRQGGGNQTPGSRRASVRLSRASIASASGGARPPNPELGQETSQIQEKNSQRWQMQYGPKGRPPAHRDKLYKIYSSKDTLHSKQPRSGVRNATGRVRDIIIMGSSVSYTGPPQARRSSVDGSSDSSSEQSTSSSGGEARV